MGSVPRKLSDTDQITGSLPVTDEVPGRPHTMADVHGCQQVSYEGAGRRPGDVETSSDDCTIYCQPCGNVLATAYCTDCSDYLCSTCTEHHRKLALTKQHTLLAGSAMPLIFPGRPVENLAWGRFNTVAAKGLH